MEYYLQVRKEVLYMNKKILNGILESLVYRYFNNENLKTLIKEAREKLHKEK